MIFSLISDSLLYSPRHLRMPGNSFQTSFIGILDSYSLQKHTKMLLLPIQSPKSHHFRETWILKPCGRKQVSRTSSGHRASQRPALWHQNSSTANTSVLGTSVSGISRSTSVRGSTICCGFFNGCIQRDQREAGLGVSSK